MKIKICLILAAGFVLAGFMNPAFSLAGGKDDLQAIVDNSVQDIKAFKTNEDVEALLSKAHGVIVYPKITKAAFLIGGEGGTGVLLGRSDLLCSPLLLTPIRTLRSSFGL